MPHNFSLDSQLQCNPFSQLPKDVSSRPKLICVTHSSILWLIWEAFLQAQFHRYAQVLNNFLHSKNEKDTSH